MLDADTRRRIDTARDILVGKVPDPKSQVEQITIALIYKFMDDIDAESEELGGERSFFAGDFARYGWAKLIRGGLGGFETLNLYAEAITRMPENPGVPQLFRDIFKNAFLPYRDPETLRAFLKIIDEFTYDHSERLGDAFEYLLSVLGSQGDAGQFRTPRHIIDFIVEIVDPTKDERIIDPACGTAGFLISAYKHVLKSNTDENGGSTLSPDERIRLAAGLKGYDISPDMVRLSLANMYLHGFSDPHIFEYDTLTSEDRWNEYADVILANPPFMSPKGGIQPHNRFSVQSRRSEVLFVDYMAGHLTPQGRAGIIVPEGIIFQSQNAHRQLRKLLVEEYLVAVVSLPAGVFQPYSGVKTSILILDKQLASRTDHIAFFKVENDGFDLGAQRRPIDMNDLPLVKTEVLEYLRRQRAGESLDDFEPTLGLVVEKEKIAENGDYNLSGERYRESVVLSKTKWPLVELGDVCNFINGRAFKPQDWERADSGGLPIVRIQNLNMPSSEFNYYTGEVKARHIINHEQLLFSWSGSRGTSFGAHIWYGDKAILNQHIFKVEFDQIRALKMYLFHALNKAVAEVEQNLHGGVGLVHITKGNLEKIQIPLPPLDVQKEIVAEIESYQKVIDGARAVVDNYRPQIAVDPEWPMVALGEVCEVKGGKRLPKGEQFAGYPTKHPYIRVSDFRNQSVELDNLKFISEEIHSQIARYAISSSDVYISIAGTIGLMGTIPDALDGANLTENAAKLSFDEHRVDKYFLSILGNGESVQNQIRSLTHAVGVPKLALERVKMLQIPLPPKETQKTIVAEIETEQAVVESNHKLLERFEKKIEAAIARVWGEGETTDAEKK